ncbi:MAG: cysteine sulfinate desulfinase/cysteine desulfurase-like protein, partial [Patiriisocius sp.]
FQQQLIVIVVYGNNETGRLQMIKIFAKAEKEY